jgi:hypothetical protein
MNPSGSQGTQCVHQDFLRVVDTDTYQQSASMCVYRATQDGPGVLPTRQVAAFEFRCDNAYSRISCRSQSLTENIRVLLNQKLAPDGSNLSSFRRLRSRKLYTYSSASSIVINFISIGCALSAPDGSSPRGYSRNFRV